MIANAGQGVFNYAFSAWQSPFAMRFGHNEHVDCDGRTPSIPPKPVFHTQKNLLTYPKQTNILCTVYTSMLKRLPIRLRCLTAYDVVRYRRSAQPTCADTYRTLTTAYLPAYRKSPATAYETRTRYASTLRSIHKPTTKWAYVRKEQYPMVIHYVLIEGTGVILGAFSDIRMAIPFARSYPNDGRGIEVRSVIV